MKQFSFLFLFINALFFGQANVSYDSSFGNNGRIFPLSTTPVLNNELSNFKSVQSIDNKIIATSSNVGISRYNLAGTLDTTFGTSGTTTVTTNSSYRIQDLGVLSDGSILVLINNNGFYSYIRKYKQDGSIDSTFGTSGSLSLFINDYATKFNRIFVLSDDTIFIGGIAETYSSSTVTVAGIIKIDKNGNYDTSFSLDGKHTVSSPGTNYNFYGLDIDSSKNVYFGYGTYVNSNYTVYVQKLSPSGNIISNFGTNGVASYTTTAGIYGSDLKVFPNGKILVSSKYFSGQSTDLCLLVFNPAGILDTTTGTGIFKYDIDNKSYDDLKRILIIDNNSFYLAGTIQTGGSQYGLVLKFNSNFALDTNFNYSGIFTTYNIINKWSSINDIILQKDRKLLITGAGAYTVGTNTNDYAGLTRLVDTKLLATNETKKTNNISIYPNPASNFINLQADKSIIDKSYEIVDMAGKSVINNKISGKEINISNLTTGNYILKIDNQSYKFIKK